MDFKRDKKAGKKRPKKCSYPLMTGIFFQKISVETYVPGRKPKE